MLNQRIKKKITLIYALGLVFGTLFIYSSLQQQQVDVDEEKEKETVEDRIIDVTLVVENGNSYKKQMKTTETVQDLLEDTRGEETFSYEKTAYVYGTVIEEVNGVKASANEEWAIYEGNNEITKEIGNTYLLNDQVYTIKLIQNEETL